MTTECPTIEEIDSSPPMEMMLPCADPCPRCAGAMQVGDYVCWGFCFQCFKKDTQ